MRRPLASLPMAVLCMTLAGPGVTETPGAQDVPVPVPGEITLAGDARPDITRFLNVRRAWAPSLSPDGRRLAFRTNITGTNQVWVVGTDGGWPEQLTFGESVTFHRWSPSGDWIVYGTDRGGNGREGYYLVSPDGLIERELLAPGEAFRQFGGFTRDGKRLAYGTTERNGLDFDIHLIDVATGEDRRVFEGRPGLYPTAWRPDGGAVILTEDRGEDAHDVFLLDVESGELTELFTPEEASSYASFSWLPDGRGFFAATNQDRDFAGIGSWALDGEEWDWWYTDSNDAEQAALSPDGTQLAWVINDGGYSRLQLVDTESRRRQGVRGLPRGIYSVTWAVDAPVAAVSVSGPQVPGDIWLLDGETAEVRRVTQSSHAGLDLTSMVEPEHVSFPSRDGLRLHGLLYRPPGTGPSDRLPVVIAVHGGPTSQARPRFQAAHQYLLSRGIAVFDLNYRGSTGYGKAFARLNDRRLRATEYLDMEDALLWLEEQGWVDGDRAAVMGGSYGGYLTMAAVTRLPGVFRAGVTFVGVSNWVTALEGASPQLKASDRLEYGDIDDPQERAFFASLSPIAYVDQVRDPVMVVHGANDPQVPVGESDQFVSAIRANGIEVEYLRFPDEGHSIRKLSNRVIAYRRVAAFLERHLAVTSEQPDT